jgi:hypothetical protein
MMHIRVSHLVQRIACESYLMFFKGWEDTNTCIFPFVFRNGWGFLGSRTPKFQNHSTFMCIVVDTRTPTPPTTTRCSKSSVVGKLETVCCKEPEQCIAFVPFLTNQPTTTRTGKSCNLEGLRFPIDSRPRLFSFSSLCYSIVDWSIGRLLDWSRLASLQ